MPSLKDAVGQDLSHYTMVTKSSPQASVPPTQDQQPILNSMIRCPLPPIFQVSPDNLRQFYQGGQVPQARIFTPNQPVITSTSTTTEFGGSSGGGSGGGGGGGTTPGTSPTSQSASITTGSLSPNAIFTSTLIVAKGFQLLSVSTGSPARVQLYGTAQAQSADSYRGLDVPPPAGTVQNLICDVVLDTSPYQWSFQDRVGANADSPQKTTIYVSITNLDITSDFITLTLVFVPLES